MYVHIGPVVKSRDSRGHPRPSIRPIRILPRVPLYSYMFAKVHCFPTGSSTVFALGRHCWKSLILYWINTVLPLLSGPGPLIQPKKLNFLGCIKGFRASYFSAS